MKLTKTELRKIIKETIDESFDNSPLSYSPPTYSYNKRIPSKKGQEKKEKKCPSDWDGCQKQHFLCSNKRSDFGEFVGNSKNNKDRYGGQMGSADYYYSRPCPEFMTKSESYIGQVIREEYQAVLEEEKKKKSAKDKMKCNSPRRIRKGEAGHGKKKFVVKACDGGTEKIIRYGDAGLKIKRKQKGRRKNFRARHNCDNPGSKLKARYWSCKNW